jgi:transcription elongation factor GreA
MLREFKITPEGKIQLENELRELVGRRAKLKQELKEARELGDLQENAEYHAAKQSMGIVTTRIEELQTILNNAEIVEVGDEAPDEAAQGCTVELQDLADGARLTYVLVSPFESDAASGRISVESPLGKALVGAHVGQEVTFEAPAGRRALKLLELRH